MNYLGLIGLLGLTGERGGEPVQAAGQIADLGGGALMAAFGILAALRERDGARRAAAPAGWRAPAAARAKASSSTCRWPTARCRGWRWSPRRYFADGVVPHRGDLPLAGSLVCYRPYECADGWVTLGALEPKFWQALCRGVGREDLIAAQFERPGSRRARAGAEIFSGRTREQWEAFAREHDCCLEPVLELDEALASELVRAREMVVEIDQPGAERPVRQLGVPVKLDAHARRARAAARPGARRAHRGGAARGRLLRRSEVAELLSEGAAAGPAGERSGGQQDSRSGREAGAEAMSATRPAQRATRLRAGRC